MKHQNLDIVAAHLATVLLQEDAKEISIKKNECPPYNEGPKVICMPSGTTNNTKDTKYTSNDVHYASFEHRLVSRWLIPKFLNIHTQP